MVKRFLPVYLFVVVLIFGGCNSYEPSNASPFLLSEYFVRYLQSQKQIKAHASFFEGDSLATVHPKTFFGGVSFQGSGMVPKDLAGKATRYTLTRKGEYEGKFQFRYKNDENEDQAHVIEMSPIEEFLLQGDISKSNGMTLIVRGGLLEKKESLILLFSDDQNRASTVTVQGPSNSIEHFIPPTNLANLSLGTGKLYLVKKKEEIVEKGRQRTISVIEFYSNTIDVEVKN